MEIKISPISKIESNLRGLLKEYESKVEENNKLINGYKEEFIESVQAGKLEAHRLMHNLKKSEQWNSILKYLFKDKKLYEYYSEENLKKIILEVLCKKINAIKSTKFSKEDFSSLITIMEKRITILEKQKYAFQIINFNYGGEDIIISENLRIVTFSDKEKVYQSPLSQLTPNFITTYNNFIVCDVYGNDQDICLEKARIISEGVVAILKIQSPNAPLISINDAYLRPYKDGWIKGYKNTEVLHWNPNLKNIDESLFDIFREYLSEPIKNDLTSSLSSSLIRFSKALTISNQHLRITEIVGCLETLLTSRGEENIVEKMVNRIKKLTSSKVDEARLKFILSDYYDMRSDYAHQSLKERNNRTNTLISIYYMVLDKILENISKFNTKKEFIHHLDN